MKTVIVCVICLCAVTFGHAAYPEETVPVVSAPFDEAQVLFAEAVTYRKNNDLIRARENLEYILEEYAHSPRIDVVKKEWGLTMWDIIHSSVDVPEAVIHEVGANDTLGKIARAYGTTIELIKIRNKLTSDIIKYGQKLSIWHTPFSLYVNKKTNNLSLNVSGRSVRIYKVSTGKSDTTTPVGNFVIKSRYPNPTWFHHGEIVPPNSPENFLGTRWLGFDFPKYGIHGTIYPELIGQSVSGGCVRMKNEDVEALYDIIPIETKVTIE